MSNLELMKKRIEFNKRKQEVEFEKLIRLRMASKGKEPAAIGQALGANSDKW